MTKNNTTPLLVKEPLGIDPLWRDDDGFIAQGTGDNYKTFADTNVNDDDIDDRERRTEQIISSFNGTIAKGYNPEAMEGLYKALEVSISTLKSVVAIFKDGPTGVDKETERLLSDCFTALKNAKL